ncbi:gliding motility-associated C-terminal domain-containing protein [Chryseolinea sp. H1M3-3]|uniref:T9SS type B sorting domain-containing protein n=1 Tax=Chryseolinea sp. H1M3-3 TaxID=3034144 RepID=UPI0023EBAEEE|nr:gliding motility-associated C-terminal domain-containing protein [Chryseolinea sp. H1M3-3]
MSSSFNWSASAQGTFLKVYDTEWSFEKVQNIIESSDDNYLIAGVYADTVGSYNLIMKVDEKGEKIWERHLGNPTFNIRPSTLITKIKNNSYLVLGSGDDVSLYRLDDDGNAESYRIDIDTLRKAESMDLTLDGNLIVAGEILQYKSLLNDIILIKTDLSGVVLWAKLYGSMDLSERPTKIFQLDDGGYIVIGNEYSWLTDNENVLVFKIDSNGNEIWRKVFDWAHQDHPTDMIETQDGNYIFMCYESDFEYVDHRIVKINKGGGIIWEKMLRRSVEGYPRTMVEIPSGGYMITGFSIEPSNNPPYPLYQLYFWRLSSDVEVLWQKKYSLSPIESTGWDIINAEDGNFITVGQVIVNENEHFDDGNFNIFLLKMDSLGCHMNHLDLGKDTVACAGPVALNAGHDYDNYQWSTGDSEPTIEVHTTGEYTLRVGTENECFKSDTVLVTIKDCTLYDRCKNIGYAEEEIKLPNVITANGDRLNEFFVVPDMMLESKLSVYNRWGSLVYFNEKYDNSWNGEGLGSGTYYYMLVNKCLSKEFKGPFSLLR